MYPVNLRWLCPIDNCGGEMKYAGWQWPVNPAGNHHTCDKCGFTAAVRGERYPRTVFRKNIGGSVVEK